MKSTVQELYFRINRDKKRLAAKKIKPQKQHSPYSGLNAKQIYAEKIKDLEIFWAEFNTTQSMARKIGLLSDMSDKVYQNADAWYIGTKRGQFNRYKDLLSLFEKPCAVCDASPIIRHHIIQIKHGGTNTPLNIIPICKNCHAMVHPHLGAIQFSNIWGS